VLSGIAPCLRGLSISPRLMAIHSTHTYTLNHTHTLSLSLSHTRTHTHVYYTCVEWHDALFTKSINVSAFEGDEQHALSVFFPYHWCAATGQCGAVCCSVLQCVAVCCSVLQRFSPTLLAGGDWGCCNVVQCGAAWCSVLQCGACMLC